MRRADSVRAHAHALEDEDVLGVVGERRQDRAERRRVRAPRCLPLVVDGAVRGEPQDEALARGFRAMKMRAHDFDPAVDERQVVETAKAMGDRMKFGVDVNQAWRVTIIGDAPLWDLTRAKRFADVCADAGLSWLEEPLPMDAYDELGAYFRELIPNRLVGMLQT